MISYLDVLFLLSQTKLSTSKKKQHPQGAVLILRQFHALATSTLKTISNFVAAILFFGWKKLGWKIPFESSKRTTGHVSKINHQFHRSCFTVSIQECHNIRLKGQLMLVANCNADATVAQPTTKHLR